MLIANILSVESAIWIFRFIRLNTYLWCVFLAGQGGCFADSL